MNDAQSQTGVSGMGILLQLQDIEKILIDSQILSEEIWGIMYGNQTQTEKEASDPKIFVVPTVARIHDRAHEIFKFLVDLKALLDKEKDGKLVGEQ